MNGIVLDANGLPVSSSGHLYAYDSFSEEERLAFQDAILQAVEADPFVVAEGTAEIAKMAVAEASGFLGQERFADAIRTGRDLLISRGVIEVVGTDELGRSIVTLHLRKVYLADFSMPAPS